jgi:hypothetical protein
MVNNLVNSAHPALPTTDCINVCLAVVGVEINENRKLLTVEVGSQHYIVVSV